MACIYADGLSPYDNKGKCGLPEKFDDITEVESKVKILSKWIKSSKHTVFHTGAGISTTAGIPDFRGPNGVWTLEAKGVKPQMSVGFDEAVPTQTHMAIVELQRKGLIKFVVSQNIDGLHIRSGIKRENLAELHGNMFVGQCNRCSRQFVLGKSVTSVGQKCLNISCPKLKDNGRKCRGKLYDTVLDWECNLPYGDLTLSEAHSSVADLSVCLGTTLQIVPSGTLPLYTKKNGGKLVICNLQPTKHDRKADLIINTYVDTMMQLLMKELDVPIPEYDSSHDIIKLLAFKLPYFDWTISDTIMKTKPYVLLKRKSSLSEHSPKKTKVEDKFKFENITTDQKSSNISNDAVNGCVAYLGEIKLENDSSIAVQSLNKIGEPCNFIKVEQSCEPLAPSNISNQGLSPLASMLDGPNDKLKAVQYKQPCHTTEMDCELSEVAELKARDTDVIVNKSPTLDDDVRFVMNNLLKELESC